MKYDVLPTVSLADLDADGFAALARDLESQERRCDVSVRTTQQADGDARESSPVTAAVRALAAGQVRAMQVRYERDGVLWVDTILRTNTAFVLVRMESDVGPS